MRIVIVTGAGSRFVDPLLGSGYSIVGIVEHRDRNEGTGALTRMIRMLSGLVLRGRRITEPRQTATAHNIPYLSLEHADSNGFATWLKARDPDLLAVYMGPFLKEEILKIPRYGAVNIHPSVLPRYRGGRPIVWMHYLFDLDGGVTVHFLDKGMDTGDIIEQVGFPIEPGMSEDSVERIAVEQHGIPMMLRAFDAIAAGRCRRIPQPRESPTPVARQMTDERCWELIDWDNWTLERTWHFLRCKPFWRSKLPARFLDDAYCYSIAGFERTRSSGRSGDIQRDRRGIFFVHPEGKIRIQSAFSLKAVVRLALQACQRAVARG